MSSESSRRNARSVRQNLASSIEARVRFVGESLSFASKRSSSANESAAEPANPTKTPADFAPTPGSLRTFTASAFATVFPIETWPSPAIATRSPRRTEMIVVARKSFMRASESRMGRRRRSDALLWLGRDWKNADVAVGLADGEQAAGGIDRRGSRRFAGKDEARQGAH